ncbi:permease [Afipia sp. P52-10]|uniref:MFS transporter n=1 Tax=Afipia sp. P52-10 TaxID=1429916 RepID=UPI0003DF1158|nr:MFS transporter [Afipia sp. P52-10]ETR78788.1 permease [Afipia sp. P52-10]
MKTTLSSTAFTVLALCFVLAVLGRGMSESFTVFLLPISSSFGWDRANVLSIYSMAALVNGLSSPFAGRLFDRAGPRVVYSLGLILIAGALLAASIAGQLWQLQMSLGLSVGLGVACIGNVPNTILLGRWFGERLPAAMAVIFSAMGAGVLVLLPVSQLLIDHAGWRGAYQIMGGCALALLVLLQLLPWRIFAAGSPDLPKTAAATAVENGWTLVGAMRHHAFWSLFSTFFFTAVGMFAISAQIVAYLVDAGFAPLQAATAWGFSGVVLVIGMLSISWLDGVIGRRPSILLSYALSIAGIAMMWLLKFYPNTILLAGFILCFGSMVGSRGPLISATAMRFFQGKNVGTIFGTISIGSGLGAALGSWCGGLIHDATGSYDLVIVFALVNVILGMIPFLVVPALRQ